MKWFRMPLGAIQTNCYILSENDGSCLIVDPGDEAKKVIEWVNSRKLKPAAILLTHAHFDHIGAVDKVRETYNIPVYLHEKEKKWLGDPSLNGSQFFPVGELIRVKDADVLIQKEEEMQLGSFKFSILETPGHSPGSISFYFEKEGFVFSGDALFQRSIGRTDLPGGNESQLLKSIHDKLLSLPEDTWVLSGHGPETTIAEEMDGNPYLNGF